MAALAWGAATDAGRVRTTNEDAYVAQEMVFAVADGMGGHQAGEVASELAATTIRDRLGAGAPSVDVVVAAVVEANAAIFQTAHLNAAQRGMGTTITAMAVLPPSDGRPEQLAIVNVGDSRVYLARQGELTRATVDHSYVQELLSTGHITEDEARAHPRRNIVTRALGIEPSVRVDSWMMPLVRGDRFVLCSDGLVDEVDDAEIHQIILRETQPQACADELVAAALDHGGRDNVTVVVVDIVDGIDPEVMASIPDDATDDETVALTRKQLLSDDGPDTLEQPVTTAVGDANTGRRITPKMFAGFVGVVAAVVLVVVLVLVALNGDDNEDPPAPTVPAVVTTTVPKPTSTTSAPGTSAPGTSAPGTATTVGRSPSATNAPNSSIVGTATSPAP